MSSSHRPSSYKWIARRGGGAAFSINLANDNFQNHVPPSSPNNTNFSSSSSSSMPKSRHNQFVVNNFSNLATTNRLQQRIIKPRSAAATNPMKKNFYSSNKKCDFRAASSSTTANTFSRNVGVEESSYIRYDPYSKNLVKTIDLGRPPPIVEISSINNHNPKKSISSSTRPISTMISRQIRRRNSNGVVSRYKVIRRTTTTTNSATKTTASSTSNGFQPKKKGNHQIANKIVTKTISQFKIRRRSFENSSSVVPPKFNKCQNQSSKPPNFRHHRNRNLYKIDRRQRLNKFSKTSEANKLRSRTLQRVLKRTWRKPHLNYRINNNNRPNITTTKKETNNGQRRDCLYYIRYGRCSRGIKCQFIHDPEKVAVCTRFLRGTCKIEDCPFSHVVSPDKMPLCRYFLSGTCNRSADECPYLHVKHTQGASECRDFERGFCPKGAKCDKIHAARKMTLKGTTISKKRPAAGNDDNRNPQAAAKTSASTSLATIQKFRKAMLLKIRNEKRKLHDEEEEGEKQHQKLEKAEPAGGKDSSPPPDFIPLVKDSSA